MLATIQLVSAIVLVLFYDADERQVAEAAQVFESITNEGSLAFRRKQAVVGLEVGLSLVLDIDQTSELDLSSTSLQELVGKVVLDNA